ncbi:hypothetical protein DJFAAGMI_00388 [Comamonas sp. PE63]|uniref:Tandem-95 repeat protein n=1 Tax=Comamonas brasiliensis TaxID=1812482 RepID=A0ABS5LMF9_9BURK|nr:hypothetical protein [Comamonas sp. PE63]
MLGNDLFEGQNQHITHVNGISIAEGGTVAVADGSVKLVGGKLVFTPADGFSGDASFSYTAQTDGGTPEQANVTVTVAANQLPEPTDPNQGLNPGDPDYIPGQTFTPGGGYTVTVGEDTPFNGKITGEDKDGDPLTYDLGTPPAHGTVVVTPDGKYTYTPNKDWSGPGTDSFEVIVDDGKGGKTTTTVTVNVTPEQDAFDDAATTGFEKSVTIDVLGNDLFEGQNQHVTHVNGTAIAEGGTVAVADGSVKLVGGQLVFTPAGGFSGDASFSYTAQTDGGTPEQANVTVTVAANQLPEPTDPNEGLNPGDPDYVPGQNFDPATGQYTVAGNEDQASINGKVTGTDADGNAITYTKKSDPGHGSVTVSPDGSYSYTPNKDWSGSDSFTIELDDGKGGKTTTTVTVNVTPEQDAFDDAATTGFEKSVTIDVLGNDLFEGQNQHITHVNGTAIADGGTVVVADGSVKLVGGQLVFTPAGGFSGDASFSYTAQTDGGTPETANVTVTVAANQLPEPTDPNQGLNPGDPDYVPGQSFDSATGQYTVTGNEDQASINGKVTGTDADGNTITYTKKSDPGHGSVTVNPDGSYSYTPNKDWSGSDSFTIELDDGKGGKTSTTVTVNVTPEQDAFDDTASTGFEKTVTIDVLGNDLFEGQNQHITHVNGTAIAEGGTVAVADGSVKLVGGKLVFTPADGFDGDASFSYTAQTDGGTAETAQVTVTVAANQLPEPTDPNEGLDPSDPDYIPGQTFTPGGGYTVTVGEDTPFNGKITGEDKDGDPLTYELGTPPAHGTVVVTPDGKYTYIPNKDWSGPGTDSFEVIVDDGKGGKTSTTVTVNVTPEQDAFDDAATTGFEKSVTIDVLGNDLFEGQNQHITHVNGISIAEGGTVAVADGSVKLVGGKLVFTPADGFSGDASFSYTAQTPRPALRSPSPLMCWATTCLKDRTSTSPTSMASPSPKAAPWPWPTAASSWWAASWCSHRPTASAAMPASATRRRPMAARPSRPMSR